MGFQWNLQSPECVGGYRARPNRSLIDPPVTFRQLLSHQIMLLAQIGPALILCLLFFFQQVVTNRDTQETLLCMACVFEVSNSEHGAQHHIYRLVKD